MSCMWSWLPPLSCRYTCTAHSGHVFPLLAAICRCCLFTTHSWRTALQLRLHTAVRMYVLQLLVFELMVWSRWAMGEYGQSPWKSPLLQTLLYALLGILVPLGLGVTMEVSCSLTHVQGPCLPAWGCAAGLPLVVPGAAVVLLGSLLRRQIQRPCLASATPAVRRSWQTSAAVRPHKRLRTVDTSSHGLPAVISLAAAVPLWHEA